MKEALNFYAIVKNPNAIIIDVDENTGAVFHSQIQKEYLKNIEREKIRAMISRYNYAGAKAFLEPLISEIRISSRKSLIVLIDLNFSLLILQTQNFLLIHQQKRSLFGSFFVIFRFLIGDQIIV